MPSVTLTPVQLEWEGQALLVEPLRIDITPDLLAWSGGFVLAGPGTGTALSFDERDLNVANRSRPIGEIRGNQVFIAFEEQVRQQEHVNALRDVISALITQVNDQNIIIAEIRAAQALAAAANDNATAVDAASGLKDSFPDPAGVLTASNAGIITIAAHERVYSDSAGTVVSVNAGSVSGLTPGATYTVFYNDAAREGGAVTYEASATNVPQVNNIHVVGTITLPDAGETDTTGTTVPAPGVIDPTRYNEYYPYYRY